MRKGIMEFIVGLFMLAGILALLFLAFRVSGFNHYFGSDYYTVYADFDNIGGLQERAPVRLAGVTVGQVSSIVLDNNTYRARVALSINKAARLPNDTSASIFTEGVLGANYVGLTPGFDDKMIANNGMIQETHPALILENLIGQFLFQFNKDEKENSPDK